VANESVPSAAAYAAMAEVARDNAIRLHGATALAQLPKHSASVAHRFLLALGRIGKLVDTGEFKHDQRREDAARFRADVNELSNLFLCG